MTFWDFANANPGTVLAMVFFMTMAITHIARAWADRGK